MKKSEGLANAKKPRPPNPKPSPKDFVWPSQRDHDDKIAQKIAASLQELLPAKGWKHTDLAREMFGTAGENDAPRNSQGPRRWVAAEHPIPSERDAGYIAELLGVSMARLLEPEGKYNPMPDMIRPRSDSTRFPVKGKKAGKTAGGRDRAAQRAYNKKYRAKQKRLKALEEPKRKYTKRALNGHSDSAPGWVLADGVKPPVYRISSDDAPPGHVNFELTGVFPHERAMAILHMIQHGQATE